MFAGTQFDPVVVETLEQVLPQAIQEIKELEKNAKYNC